MIIRYKEVISYLPKKKFLVQVSEVFAMFITEQGWRVGVNFPDDDGLNFLELEDVEILDSSLDNMELWKNMDNRHIILHKFLVENEICYDLVNYDPDALVLLRKYKSENPIPDHFLALEL